MEKILVTVILPIYNAEKYLKKCINSILRQTYKNLEIVLVNDGSTDNSEKICKDYMQKDDRITYIKQENLGVSVARNKGLDQARGQYIIFIDADDYIEKNTVEVLIKKAIEEKCDIIRYGYVRETKFLKKAYKFSTDKNIKISKQYYSEKVYPYLISTGDFSSTCTTLLKKEIINNIRFDENLKYGEDFKFMVQAILNSETIFVIPKALYHYRYNFSSATNIKNIIKQQKKLEDDIKSYLDIAAELDDLYPVKEQIQKRIEGIVMDMCSIVAEKNKYSEYKSQLEKIMNNSNIIEIEKNVSRMMQMDMWRDVLEYDYYKKLQRCNFKRKIKRMILKVL